MSWSLIIAEDPVKLKRTLNRRWREYEDERK